MGPIQKKRGANLPHWTADGAAYFITFRLGDSLPREVIDNYKQQKALLTAASKKHSPLLVRNTDDLLRCVRYTLNNPARAALQNWKWVGRND